MIPCKFRGGSLVWVVILLTGIDAGAQFEYPTAPDKLVFTYNANEAFDAFEEHFFGWAAEIADVKGEESQGYIIVIGGTQSTASTIRKQSEIGPAERMAYSTMFRVQRGSVVGLFGRCYRVTNLRASGGVAVMNVMQREEHPAGMSNRKDVFMFPLAGKASFAGGGGTFYVSQIVRSPEGDWTACVENDPVLKENSDNPHAPFTVVSSKRSQVVKVGDTLQLPHRGKPNTPSKLHFHKVVAIVPPDAEKKVIGWVEVEHEPFKL